MSAQLIVPQWLVTRRDTQPRLQLRDASLLPLDSRERRAQLSLQFRDT